MPRLTLTVQDGPTTTLALERDLDDAEVGPFLEGWGDGWEAADDGLPWEPRRTYDTDLENEAHTCGANLGATAARWAS